MTINIAPQDQQVRLRRDYDSAAKAKIVRIARLQRGTLATLSNQDRIDKEALRLASFVLDHQISALLAVQAGCKE